MNLSTETAVFALGNFWEPEYEFSKLPGVIASEVGYTGGTSSNPTFHDIGDHSEALQIEFDPHIISYDQLLKKFWKLHDPTAEYKTQLRSCIFYIDETQREQAETSKAALQALHGQDIATSIEPAGKFHPAEGYNQHYIARMRGEL